MTASAAVAALALPPCTDTYGIPNTQTRLIAKLRNMDPTLRAEILGTNHEQDRT
jgi:hypothetical protein